jgi:acyl-CoA thioesterase
MDLLERTDGRAVVECVVLPEHANTRGAAHGGVISSLIDMACGAAVAYQPSIEGKGAVTVALTVNYLHPAAQGERLRAVGMRVGTSKRIVTSRAEVTNQAGVVLAVGVATLRVVG